MYVHTRMCVRVREPDRSRVLSRHRLNPSAVIPLSLLSRSPSRDGNSWQSECAKLRLLRIVVPTMSLRPSWFHPHWVLTGSNSEWLERGGGGESVMALGRKLLGPPRALRMPGRNFGTNSRVLFPFVGITLPSLLTCHSRYMLLPESLWRLQCYSIRFVLLMIEKISQRIVMLIQLGSLLVSNMRKPHTFRDATVTICRTRLLNRH